MSLDDDYYDLVTEDEEEQDFSDDDHFINIVTPKGHFKFFSDTRVTEPYQDLGNILELLVEDDHCVNLLLENGYSIEYIKQ